MASQTAQYCRVVRVREAHRLYWSRLALTETVWLVQQAVIPSQRTHIEQRQSSLYQLYETQDSQRERCGA